MGSRKRGVAKAGFPYFLARGSPTPAAGAGGWWVQLSPGVVPTRRKAKVTSSAPGLGYLKYNYIGIALDLVREHGSLSPWGRISCRILGGGAEAVFTSRVEVPVSTAGEDSPMNVARASAHDPLNFSYLRDFQG